MTFGMQIRYWYRRATRLERHTTMTVALTVALALVASVVSRPGAATDEGLAGGVTSIVDGGATGPLGPGGPSMGGSGAGLPGAGQGPGSTLPRGTTSGPGGGTLRGATRSGGGERTGGTVPRSASDRGITADSVKIGFLVANLSGLDGAGFALNIREDTPQYAQALADEVNRTGGVNGRKVVVAVRKTDPTSQSDQAAACQAMINDAKVFGVVDVGSLADTPAFECIATQNKTPFVHNTIWGSDWLARSGGMEVGYPAAIERISKTWTRDLAAMKWAGEGAVVGILADNCVATAPIVDKVLKPDFERMPGVRKVVVAKHDCDLESVVSQPPTFVTQFRSEGVTHVAMASNFVSGAVFTTTAENQLFRPKYTVSDWWQMTSDSSSANYDPNQFDGAVAISSLGLMLPASGKAPYPGGDRCMKAAQHAGLEPLKYDGRNHELWAMCDNFFLMLDGIRNAGVNPTRPAWAAAIQHLGRHPSVLFGPSEFRPGKVTGSDRVHTLRWRRDCKCFRSVSGFRAAAA